MQVLTTRCLLALDAAKHAGIPVDHIQSGSEAEVAAAIRQAVADDGGFTTSMVNGMPDRKKDRPFWCNAVPGEQAKRCKHAHQCNQGQGDSELEALAIALLASTNKIVSGTWDDTQYPATIEEAFSLVLRDA